MSGRGSYVAKLVFPRWDLVSDAAESGENFHVFGTTGYISTEAAGFYVGVAKAIMTEGITDDYHEALRVACEGSVLYDDGWTLLSVETL